MNWMRLCVPWTVAASARASCVLPVPGKSSRSMCPSRQQAGQGEPRDVLLAEHGPLDVADELVEGVREPGHLLLRDAHGFRSPVVQLVDVVVCR